MLLQNPLTKLATALWRDQAEGGDDAAAHAVCAGLGPGRPADWALLKAPETRAWTAGQEPLPRPSGRRASWLDRLDDNLWRDGFIDWINKEACSYKLGGCSGARLPGDYRPLASQSILPGARGLTQALEPAEPSGTSSEGICSRSH